MTKFKPSKKFIKISVAVVVCFVILIFMLNGINLVPSKFRNKAVSVFTQNLTWGSRPSDIISEYGLPEDICKASDITGERDFNFNFEYDEKNVGLIVSNRYFLNASPHRYTFTIECKTPEEASACFDKYHNEILELYKDTPDFQFSSTDTPIDYKYINGEPCSYMNKHEDGKEKVYIIDDSSKEIPIEEADNVVKVYMKENNYKIFNTTGINYSLVYREGESVVTLRAEAIY